MLRKDNYQAVENHVLKKYRTKYEEITKEYEVIKGQRDYYKKYYMQKKTATLEKKIK